MHLHDRLPVVVLAAVAAPELAAEEHLVPVVLGRLPCRVPAVDVVHGLDGALLAVIQAH